MKTPWFLLALLPLLLPLAAAQPAEFPHRDYLVRIGEGDLTITEPEEPAGWTVAEYLRFTTEGGEHRISLASDAGQLVDASCVCGNVTVEGNELVVRGAEAGTHQVRYIRTFPAANAFLADFALHGGQDGRIVAYVPDDHHVDTNAQPVEQDLACTDAPCTIKQYDMQGSTHFAVLPGQPPLPADDEDGPLDDVFPVLIGALAGVLLWAFLVQRGYVQRRRRQEVTTAAHVQAAGESKEVLQARKRVLMAGLKDLEMARMNKEIDDATYDRLKAELKKETVTVMRALEGA